MQRRRYCVSYRKWPDRRPTARFTNHTKQADSIDICKSMLDKYTVFKGYSTICFVLVIRGCEKHTYVLRVY
ncbi:hypothetical protein CRM22_010725 [Opisthorchis felineus]|uniref:Uncharacterized protein n=1 Tax=Opisthorchis felineus TaxID=147828 RepID=A0A4S2KUB7_OPIFE|nr:hypothetical protein CRM22_010725 [Opisthorchis felineus]